MSLAFRLALYARAASVPFRSFHGPSAALGMPRGRANRWDWEQTVMQTNEPTLERTSSEEQVTRPAAPGKWVAFLAEERSRVEGASDLNLQSLNKEFPTAFGAIRLDSVRSVTGKVKIVLHANV